MASAAATQAIASGNLVDLVSSSASATIYPNDDAILAVLQARSRAELPYTRVGATNLIVVNPFKILANLNDASAREYEERSYKDAGTPFADSTKPLQPHAYDMAARMYLLLRRRNESHAVITRGITASGKSASSRLLIDQLLRLSTHSKKEAKISEQIKCLCRVLDSFGNAKTLLNPNASRHSRFLELHFSERGRIANAKVLAWGLDKTRLMHLSHEERTYHVFYQFLAGATPQERDYYNLEDASDYALLRSSGCYRLPSGPFTDDEVAMDSLRAAMKTLGIKPKNQAAIFSLLVAILLLGNIEFGEADHKDVSAYVLNMPVLDQVARLLGVSSEDLSQCLTNKTNYVRKELYTVLLSASQSAAQRDELVANLYSILFAFVVETINNRVAPNSKDPFQAMTQIAILDQPGYQTRTTQTLVAAQGQNSFEEFCVNFTDELINSYLLRHTFEDSVGYNSQAVGDGVTLHTIATTDNSACVELLRGASLSERAQKKPGGLLGVMYKSVSSYKSGKDRETADAVLHQDLTSSFGVHTSFIKQDRPLFGIHHYAGPCLYDTTDFVERDTDLFDAAFVTLLRNSDDPFLVKLLSGPSLAAELHPKDESIVVQAQVASYPLRKPTPIMSPDGALPSPSAEHPRLDPDKTFPVTTQLNYALSEVMTSLDRSRLWGITCIRPNDSGSPNSFDKRRVRAQIHSLLLADMASRRSVEFVADYGHAEFCERYLPTIQGAELDRVRQCARANGWQEGVDYAVGLRSVWLTYDSWKTVEDQVRAGERSDSGEFYEEESVMHLRDDQTEMSVPDVQLTPGGAGGYGESSDNLIRGNVTGNAYGETYGDGGLATTPRSKTFGDTSWGDDNEKDGAGDGNAGPNESKEGGLVVNDAGNAVEVLPTTSARRWWVRIVWACTFLIPSWSLHLVGRMKRPDIRLAWREKFTIFWLIFLLNATVIFYIAVFGRLLCPDYDKAWNTDELAQHTGSNDFYVAVQGVVYDVSNFVHGDHSDISGEASNDADVLSELAGSDLTDYFPVPLALGCSGLVSDQSIALTYSNFTPAFPTAVHTSGYLQSAQKTALDNENWYTATFLPTMNEFKKGAFVYDRGDVYSQAQSSSDAKIWAFYENGLYDLTDYLNTVQLQESASGYNFLDSSITSVFKNQAGEDITTPLNQALAKLNSTYAAQNMDCLKHVFYIGEADFRKTARCQVQNVMLIIASVMLMSSMLIKFLCALQLTGKRTPEMLDKFVLCQVPCYTEGEDSLRRTIDSLAALNYDDKRKLIFVICDGNIIGSGNDRTTPRIVLDILGVDPKIDPEPLLFKSVGEGSKQLNYGKIYSGLYEFEGHVVPYMVVVKVGKPTERSKPGNRGKRDSQILVMHYLNRVHFDAPMSPLELEIYHQMRNVIGIDPAFYEYIFTIDADTTVTPDSLNRLVAAAADDSAIIGICGETKLENPEQSWWTMIQVYEYYISHHLSKAFESLFGSVSCLPGCFSLYRIRTADKGRPIIISNRVIDDYAEGNVDTLHKKNLFSLGEDRYLTTLLLKHFPTFKTKFIPDAIAHTVAPESWRVLFSQRRRWINSTVHNLFELVFLPELFGFCCFSMRFFVFIDLLGTLILPSTVVYLVYLVIMVSLHKTAFPLISLIMIAVTYGFQAIIFLIKREFMLIGWMVVYLLSYPVYSFFLPVYSFWCMDEFGWGNTRLVIGEGNNKKIMVSEDDKFDESMIPLKKFSEYEAEAWETGSRHSDNTYKTEFTQPRSQFHAPSRGQSPHSFQQASMSGDYYRDTDVIRGGSNSRAQNAPSIRSQQGAAPYAMSQYGGMPQLPMMPFGTGPGSAAGSEYGGMSMPVMAPMPYQHTGSMYGMDMMGGGAPRNTIMSNMNMFASGSASQLGGAGNMASPFNMQQRPMSTFSMATTANLLQGQGPSMNPDPSDDELFASLKSYLATQDLMTVTKKTAREAMSTRFPKADISGRKDFLNQSIDKILSES